MLTADGDYSFGAGSANFFINNNAMVVQSVLTRLRLWQGEWFLDVTEGTPWLQQVLSSSQKNTKNLYDLAIQNRVLQTSGVTGITDYSSDVVMENNNSKAPRKLSVSMTISTVYGTQENITVTL